MSPSLMLPREDCRAARHSFLRSHTLRHLHPIADAPLRDEPAAHAHDPARDVLALMSIRTSVEAAWNKWFPEVWGRVPSPEERRSLRERLFDLTSLQRFFYSHSEQNLYWPVEVCKRGDRDQSWPELSELLRALADDGDHSGVLLVAGSGSGKTVAEWKAYFDCLAVLHEAPPGEVARRPYLGDFVPCWIRAANEWPVFEEYRRLSPDELNAALENVTASVLLEILALTAQVDQLLPNLLAGMTDDEAGSRRQRAERTMRWYLHHGPRLLLFLDLNHFGELERRVIARSMAVFQKQYGTRHRCVAAYRSAAGSSSDDEVRRSLARNEQFREYDLRTLPEDAAAAYLRRFREFERRVLREIGNAELERFRTANGISNNSPVAGIPLPDGDIDEDCQKLRLLVRRTVRPNFETGAEEPLISTPLLMHWVSLVDSSDLRQIRNVTHLYRKVIAQHLAGLSYPGSTIPASLTSERFVTALTRIALAIQARGSATRLGLRDVRNLLRDPALGRKGATYPWWPDESFWHQGSYFRESFSDLEIDRIFATGLFRRDPASVIAGKQDGDTGFIHDSLIYYFAGAVALREYKWPNCPGPDDRIDDEWVPHAAGLLTGDMRRWALAAEFLGGALLPEARPTPAASADVASLLARDLIVPLVVRQGGAEHVELLLRFVRGLSDDPVLREVEHGLLGDGAFLHEHPQAVLQQVYNRLRWTGTNADECGELGQRCYAAYRARPIEEQFSWLRIDYGPRQAKVLTMRQHQASVQQLAVVPDGRIVSGDADGAVKLWDPTTGEVQTMNQHHYSVNSLSALLDGRIASGSQDNTVKLWNPTTGTVLTMDQHQWTVRDVVALADGRIVSCSNDGTIKVWNPATGHVLTMAREWGRTSSSAALPDGRIVSTADDDTVTLWDPTTGDVRCMTEHQKHVTSLIALPDGRIVSGSMDHTVKLWDPVTDQVQTMADHRAEVTCVNFLSCGRIVSGSFDRTVKVWDPATGDIQTMDGHESWVTCVAPVPNGRVASGDLHGIVRLWDPMTNDVRTMDQHLGKVECVAALVDGSIVSGSEDRTVKLWDPSKDDVRSTDPHSNSVCCVSVFHDGRVVSGARYDDGVRLWNPATGDVRTIKRFSGSDPRVATLRDGRIVVGTHKCVALWDPKTGFAPTVIEHQKEVTSIAVLRNRRIVSGSEDHTVKLFDPITKRVGTMNEHQDDVTSVALLADRRVVSGSYDKSVKLWDPATGNVRTMTAHQDRVTCVAVLLDGRIMSGSRDAMLVFWDHSNDHAQTFSLPNERVTSLTVLADGRIVSGSLDGIVSVWTPPERTDTTMTGVCKMPIPSNCAAAFPRAPRFVVGSGRSLVIIDVEPTIDRAHADGNGIRASSRSSRLGRMLMRLVSRVLPRLL